MVCICVPSWPIVIIRLIAPGRPPLRLPRAKSSRKNPGLHASMISYCSSGLRECSRFREAKRLTCRRPGESVRAFLPRTPNSKTSVTLRNEIQCLAVGTTVLSDLVPDDVGFVVEAPCFHYCEPFGQQGLGTKGKDEQSTPRVVPRVVQ